MTEKWVLGGQPGSILFALSQAKRWYYDNYSPIKRWVRKNFKNGRVIFYGDSFFPSKNYSRTGKASKVTVCKWKEEAKRKNKKELGGIVELGRASRQHKHGQQDRLAGLTCTATAAASASTIALVEKNLARSGQKNRLLLSCSSKAPRAELSMQPVEERPARYYELLTYLAILIISWAFLSRQPARFEAAAPAQASPPLSPWSSFPSQFQTPNSCWRFKAWNLPSYYRYRLGRWQIR